MHPVQSACSLGSLLSFSSSLQQRVAVQEAAEKRAHVVQFAHLLNAEQGVDFVPQSVIRQLTEAH